MDAVSVELCLLGLAVGLAFFAQSVTGFGAVLIALTLGALVFPLQQLVPVMIALTFPHSFYLLSRYHPHVDWPLLLREILPLMLLGLPVGILLARHLPEAALQWLLGIIVLLVAGRELFRLLRDRATAVPVSMPRFYAWTGAAGAVQGMFGTGGPLLVYGLSRHGLEKGAFRATLLVLWPTLNAALMGYFLYAGRWTAWSTTTFLWMLPPLAVGIVLGDFLHHRISERQFNLVLQGLLLLSGLGLLSK